MAEHGDAMLPVLHNARCTHNEDGSWSAVPGMNTSLKKPRDT